MEANEGGLMGEEERKGENRGREVEKKKEGMMRVGGKEREERKEGREQRMDTPIFETWLRRCLGGNDRGGMSYIIADCTDGTGPPTKPILSCGTHRIRIQ